MMTGEGTWSIECRAIMACGVGAGNGIWPTSISYSTHPNA
jgi:hypothetical protein